MVGVRFTNTLAKATRLLQGTLLTVNAAGAAKQFGGRVDAIPVDLATPLAGLRTLRIAVSVGASVAANLALFDGFAA